MYITRYIFTINNSLGCPFYPHDPYVNKSLICMMKTMMTSQIECIEKQLVSTIAVVIASRSLCCYRRFGLEGTFKTRHGSEKVRWKCRRREVWLRFVCCLLTLYWPLCNNNNQKNETTSTMTTMWCYGIAAAAGPFVDVGRSPSSSSEWVN